MGELIKWATAVPALIGFGLALGVNPALYGATADALARNLNVGARLRWMIAGLFTGSTLLVFLLHSFDPRNLEAMLKSKVDAALLSRNVDLIAAVLFLLAAAVLIAWRIRVPKMVVRPARVPKDNAHSLSYYFLGLSCSVVGFTTLPIMYLTGRVVTGLSDDPALRVLAFVIFLIALGSPFIALAWIWSRFPRLAKRVTETYAAAQHWDYRWLAAGFLVAAGIALVLFALVFHR